RLRYSDFFRTGRGHRTGHCSRRRGRPARAAGRPPARARAGGRTSELDVGGAVAVEVDAVEHAVAVTVERLRDAVHRQVARVRRLRQVARIRRLGKLGQLEVDVGGAVAVEVDAVRQVVAVLVD